MTFICDKCRAGAHDQCPGGTWCDCLHRRIRPLPSIPDVSNLFYSPRSDVSHHHHPSPTRRVSTSLSQPTRHLVPAHSIPTDVSYPIRPLAD